MIEPLRTRYVMNIKALIDPVVEVGSSDKGERRFIPIIGGEVSGDTVKGEVLPGGADWQLTRPDGVLEIKAIYAIRTHDGAVINVENVGIVSQGEQGPYVRTHPRFEAPRGPYDWLNKRLFVATITPSPNRDYVSVDVFEVI